MGLGGKVGLGHEGGGDGEKKFVQDPDFVAWLCPAVRLFRGDSRLLA